MVTTLYLRALFGEEREEREERKERESRKGGRLKKCNFSKIRNEILVDRDELAHDEPLWLSI